jgi:hypothetical protein
LRPPSVAVDGSENVGIDCVDDCGDVDEEEAALVSLGAVSALEAATPDVGAGTVVVVLLALLGLNVG